MYRTVYIYIAIELFIAWLIFLFACVIYPIFNSDFYAHLTYWNAQSAHLSEKYQWSGNLRKYQIFHDNISETFILVCSKIVIVLCSTLYLTIC